MMIPIHEALTGAGVAEAEAWASDVADKGIDSCDGHAQRVPTCWERVALLGSGAVARCFGHAQRVRSNQTTSTDALGHG